MADELYTTEWTVETLRQYIIVILADSKAHFEARAAQLEHKAELIMHERDIRYAETNESIRRDSANIKEVIIARLDANDKATVILAESINRVPTALDREVSRLTALTDEKFNSVWKQFSEVTLRASASEDAAKVGVAAALQAQKEAAAAQNTSNTAAIAKSETATTKQLDSILALLASNASGINDKIQAINDRITRSERLESTVTGRSEGVKQNSSQILAIVMAGLALAGLAVNWFATQQNSQRMAQTPEHILVPR